MRLYKYNIEGARGEINGETFTATIKVPEGGEAMICVKGEDHVLKYVFLRGKCEKQEDQVTREQMATIFKCVCV